MTTETFVIKIQQQGAQAATAAIGAIGPAAASTGKSVTATTKTLALFRKALVAFSAFKAAQVFVGFVDSIQEMSNKLKQATKSTEEFARAQQFLYKISRETGTAVVDNTTVYSRLLIATEKLNLKTGDAEKIMSTLSKSVLVAGASSEEASNALTQFAQGLASGSLRGQDLNSVVSFLPPLAKLIGKEFGVAGGELRAFANANPGIITTERIMKAVLKGAEDMNTSFSKMDQTVQQAFNNIATALRKFIGEMNEGIGLSGMLVKGLNLIADNITIVIGALTVLTGIKLAMILAGWSLEAYVFATKLLLILNPLTLVQRAVVLLNAALLTNPFVLIGVAIAALVAALYVLYTTVPEVQAFFDSLWESLKIGALFIMDIFSSAWETIRQAMLALAPAFAAVGAMLASAVEGWKILIGVWYELVSAYTPLGIILDNLGPIIGVVAQAISVVLIGAFSILIVAVRGVTEILNYFGAVSDETANKIRASSAAWFEYAGKIDETTAASTRAIEQQKQAATAVEGAGTSATKAADGVVKFNDGMDDMGNLTNEPISVLDSLGLTLDTVAPAAERTADSLNKTSDATVTIEKMTSAATETMKRLNPELFAGEESGAAAAQGFDAAGSAASRLTSKINALAEAYKKLNAASGGAGAAQISGGMGTRAEGGPVRRGGVYLVGEEGPEIFTPGVSGYITSNDESVAMMGSAANSNVAPSSSTIGNNAARAMAASAAYMSDSAEVVATAVKKWTMTNYMDSKYADNIKYQPGTMEDRWANYGGSRTVNGTTVSGADYTRPDGSRPLPGDADYVAQLARSGGIWGSPTGMRGGVVYSGTQDFNDPSNDLRNTALFYSAIGNNEMAKVFTERADAMIEELKRIRDTTASFKAFQEQQKALMGTNRYDGVGDFQTLLPMLGLGGTSMGEHDPYGLMKWKEPAQAQSSPSSSRYDEENRENKKEIRVQMNVFTPSAESFRQNRATIEANLAGMVKRANRRAGG